MCRLLSVVVREPRGFRQCLCEAPRSLAALGREHADGWGIAVHNEGVGWKLTKRSNSANSDPEFDSAATDAGAILVAHVRKRTVGAVAFENTHPFRHGEWVFAHNGTIERVAELRAATTGASAEPTGDTDSEVLLAFLMGQLGSHPSAYGSRFVTEMLLARAVEDLAGIPSLGSATFVLSDGVVLYAYRHGRPLYFLERHAQDSGRLEAILVASEPVTADESWIPVPERALLAVWRRPRLGCDVIFEAPRAAVPHPSLV